MGIQAVLSMAGLLCFTFLATAREAASERVPFRGEDLCAHKTRNDCTAAAAGGEVCVWCDLPQLCFPAARIHELGEGSCFSFSTRSLRHGRRLLDDSECGAIAKKGLCSRVDYCRWCRSDLLDDSCFGAAEAARLPRSIFDCSPIYSRT